jgi:hypothetical protein
VGVGESWGYHYSHLVLPVETRSLVTKAMLTGGKLAKILGSFWDGFIIKFEDDPPSGF